MSLNLDLPLGSPTLSAKLLDDSLRSRFADRLSEELHFSFDNSSRRAVNIWVKDTTVRTCLVKTLRSELMTVCLFQTLRHRAVVRWLAEGKELPKPTSIAHFSNNGHRDRLTLDNKTGVNPMRVPLYPNFTMPSYFFTTPLLRPERLGLLRILAENEFLFPTTPPARNAVIVAITSGDLVATRAFVRVGAGRILEPADYEKILLGAPLEEPVLTCLTKPFTSDEGLHSKFLSFKKKTYPKLWAWMTTDLNVRCHIRHPKRLVEGKDDHIRMALINMSIKEPHRRGYRLQAKANVGIYKYLNWNSFSSTSSTDK